MLYITLVAISNLDLISNYSQRKLLSKLVTICFMIITLVKLPVINYKYFIFENKLGYDVYLICYKTDMNIIIIP